MRRRTRRYQQVAELAAVGRDDMTRYYLNESVLSRIDAAAIIKAWDSSPQPQRDAVEKEVHAFVLHRLKLVMNMSAKAVRP